MNQTSMIRYCSTRESAHLAARDGYAQAQLLIAMGKRVKVTFEEAEDELSVKQRGFLHKAVFPQIEEQYVHPDGTRSEWRTWKEYFRARFLGDRYVLRRSVRWDAKAGVMVLAKRKTPHRERVSTEDLGVRAYSRYIDTVIDTATVELGVEFRFLQSERDGARYVTQPSKAKPAAQRDAQAETC